MYLKRASAYGTIAAKRLSYRGGMSFFSPLAGQPKKMTHCAMSHGTIAARRLSDRGGMSFFSPLAGQPKKMTPCIMTAQRHDTIAAAAKAARGRERTAGEGWL